MDKKKLGNKVRVPSRNKCLNKASFIFDFCRSVNIFRFSATSIWHTYHLEVAIYLNNFSLLIHQDSRNVGTSAFSNNSRRSRVKHGLKIVLKTHSVFWPDYSKSLTYQHSISSLLHIRWRNAANVVKETVCAGKLCK